MNATSQKVLAQSFSSFDSVAFEEVKWKWWKEEDEEEEGKEDDE